MGSINSSWHPLNAVMEINWILYLRDIWVNNPYGRVCCKARKNIPTICDGTCWDCKKEMAKYRQNEPLRMKANDIIRSGGDATDESIELEIYRRNLEMRIARWQKQKQEIIANMNRRAEDEKSLQIKVRDRHDTVLKMLISPTMPHTLQ